MVDPTDVPRMDAFDLGVLVGIAVLATLAAFGIQGPVRTVLALAFLAFVPGWVLTGEVRSLARLPRIPVAVLLSLAISAALATVSLWVHVWHPVGMFVVVAVVCAASIARRVWRRHSSTTT
jgi:uncharacterized membrane protein